MKQNVALVGFMGTGKTTIGKLLAKKLDLTFVDTDELIELSHNKTIAEIFSQEGEEAFRKIESTVVKTFAKEKQQIIATGGGAIVKEENLHALSESSHVICLKASPESILQRVEGNSKRPLLSNDDRLTKIKELLEKRTDSYNRADFFVYTDSCSCEEVVEKIVDYLKEKSFFQ